MVSYKKNEALQNVWENEENVGEDSGIRANQELITRVTEQVE